MNFTTIQEYFYKNRYIFVGLLGIFILIHFLKPRKYLPEEFTNYISISKLQ
jgi:hypothetical protein